MENGRKRYEISSISATKVIITFYETAGNEDSDKSKSLKTITKTYNVMSLDEIRDSVQKGQPIHLDNCYVKDFSYRIVSDNHRKPLISFSASSAFFEGNTDFSGAIFEGGDVSFFQTIFGYGKVDFSNAHFGNGDVIFSLSEFVDQSVNFYRTDFGNGNVTFFSSKFSGGKILFSNAVFGDGSISFSGAEFGNVSFDLSDVKFGSGKVSFSGATFKGGDFKFNRTKFGPGDVSFSGVDFGNGFVSFAKTEFCDGDIYFINAKLDNGKILFKLTDFNNVGRLDFKSLISKKGAIVFDRCVLNQIIFLNVHKLSKLEFINCTNNHIIDFNTEESKNRSSEGNQFLVGIFLDMIFVCIIAIIFSVPQIACSYVTVILLTSGIILFWLLHPSIVSNCHRLFRYVFTKFFTNKADINKKSDTENCNAPQIDELVFINMNNMGTILLKWNVYRQALLNYAKKDKSTSDDLDDLINIQQDEFKMLKQNFNSQGYYDWEDEAYFEYMNKHRRSNSVNPIRSFILNFFERCGKYGTDYFSIATAMLCVVFIFGVIYRFAPHASIYPGKSYGRLITPFSDGKIIMKGTDASWWAPLYYSAITFFTVGYGDLSAQNGFTAMCCVIESFLGVFLMSYFSVAVVRRLLR